jgi:hypothetical protein
MFVLLEYVHDRATTLWIGVGSLLGKCWKSVGHLLGGRCLLGDCWGFVGASNNAATRDWWRSIRQSLCPDRCGLPRFGVNPNTVFREPVHEPEPVHGREPLNRVLPAWFSGSRT